MSKNLSNSIHIIGGGLAGSEAAWQAAEQGAKVILHEMRPIKKTDVHHTENFAELVCSNSFRSDDYEYNAVGLLHEEMRRANSIIMACADKHALPAGGALAVDREAFSQCVTDAIIAHPNIVIERGEIDDLPPQEWNNVIIATGPLTSESLANAIGKISGKDSLSFFDAIAPIIHSDSINRDIVWAQSRYDKVGPKGSGADYLNCPMNEQQYNDFIDALLAGEKTQFNEWENVPYFEACLPIEVMAERGRETLRFGPMKPVGLTNPKDPDVKPYAIVQLRQDNQLGSLWNMVGFQTKLKYGEQAEIFRMIPGLEEAQFARLGGLHRNTFLNSPEVLTPDLRLKNDKRIRFAGQISGVEGYVESSAMGLVTGRLAAADALGLSISTPPKTTALGSLVNHITGGHLADEANGIKTFQPMNINFGLMPDIEVKKPEGVKRWRKADRKKVKKKAISSRALEDLMDWL
jgi:methylenetetrahydrofolate--tRNA-(uracil-5-)-methyltransferase